MSETRLINGDGYAVSDLVIKKKERIIALDHLGYMSDLRAMDKLKDIRDLLSQLKSPWGEDAEAITQVLVRPKLRTRRTI